MGIGSICFNLFNKNALIKEHKEDFYLTILCVIFCILIYFNNFEGLDIIISVVSSLANSGLTLIDTDNNLSLYFLLITIVGGSLISNSSGIKLTRFYILLKIFLSCIHLVFHPCILYHTYHAIKQKCKQLLYLQIIC